MNKNIIKLETRRGLYKLISKNPGLHLQEICRRTNIPNTTLRYHLNFLKKNGLITEKSEDYYNRYYISNKIGVKDKKILHLLRAAFSGEFSD